jgi:hypothetical protein
MSRIVILLFCAAMVYQSKAQLYIGNFIGETSDQVNGTWNYEVPLGFPIPLKRWDNKHKIVLYPAYTFSQTFLSDQWVFDSDGQTTTVQLDDTPNRVYENSLFKHQSKIRMWAWEAWLGFETKIGKSEVHFAYAPSFIQVGSFRRRFEDDNEVTKVKDRFRDKADYYNINRFRHRLKGSISLYGLGVGGYLNLTPFFDKSTGIDLTKFGITLVVRQSFWSRLFDLDLSDDPEERSNPDAKKMMF